MPMSDTDMPPLSKGYPSNESAAGNQASCFQQGPTRVSGDVGIDFTRRLRRIRSPVMPRESRGSRTISMFSYQAPFGCRASCGPSFNFCGQKSSTKKRAFHTIALPYGNHVLSRSSVLSIRFFLLETIRLGKRITKAAHISGAATFEIAGPMGKWA
jgi:hypothetical protein